MSCPRSLVPALLAVSLLVAGGPAARADGPAPVAVLTAVEGPVSWRAAEPSPFRAAHPGDRLYPGAFLRTGARAEARLRWWNGGSFRLMALSELAIPDADGVRVNVGRVWAQFQEKLFAPFYFRSPSATALIRGTTLSVRVAQGATRVAVTEGHVEVTDARGGRVMLGPGQAVEAGAAGALGPLEPLGPEDGAEPAAMNPLARLEDFTRRAIDVLERNRAAERLPLLRQDMEPQPAAPAPTPGPVEVATPAPSAPTPVPPPSTPAPPDFTPTPPVFTPPPATPEPPKTPEPVETPNEHSGNSGLHKDDHGDGS